MRLVATTFFIVLSVATAEQDFGGHALFVRTADADAAHSRVQRAAAPASPADVMAQNILEWIQGIYQQGVRKTRQQSDSNAYLPPYSTQRPPEKPRPFQAVTNSQQNAVTSFPVQRPSSLYTPPNTGYSASRQSSSTPYSTPQSSYPSNQQPSSTFIPQGFSGSTSYNPRPSQPSYSNIGSSAFPPLNYPESSTTYLPSRPPFFPSTTPRPSVPSSIQTGNIDLEGAYSAIAVAAEGQISGNKIPGEEALASPRTFPPAGYNSGYYTTTTHYTPTAARYTPITTRFTIPPTRATTRYTTPPTTRFTIPPTRATPRYTTPPTIRYTTPRTTIRYTPTTARYTTPTIIPGSPGYPRERPTSTLGYPSSTLPPITIPPLEISSSGITTGPGVTTGPETGPSEETSGTFDQEELKHPPHIHNLDVICSKTMMTINIEFNRAFDGVIYSKGYYTNPECRYVEQNSGRTQYSFTVSLNSCGTQFINDFEGEAGQAYLENVLVLQNEPGIQEVWDTVRRVRCLWEGNINKALTVNLSVDMLKQEIVTFSGDTATARLDIQIGKGPFAPAAGGLVKIGETMTLVVSVEGDPGFDLQVRDCVARDETSINTLQLTDERGCILKPKLFGAFQKTKDTGNTGASIIAYAFFQAFKFPDVMDLFIECNVELCKTDCEPCPYANQQIEPGRRRRSVTYVPPSNTTTNPILISDPVRVGQSFKVIMLDDLSTASSQILESMEETAVETITKAKDICMSNSGFYTAFSLMLSTIFVTIISAAMLYVKLQRLRRPKFVDS